MGPQERLDPSAQDEIGAAFAVKEALLSRRDPAPARLQGTAPWTRFGSTGIGCSSSGVYQNAGMKSTGLAVGGRAGSDRRPKARCPETAHRNDAGFHPVRFLESNRGFLQKLGGLFFA